MALRKNGLILAAAQVVLILALLSSHKAIVIIMAEECKTEDIDILQKDDGTYPNRIPMFRVQISNTFTNPSCTISDVHLHCGWFASAEVINPKLFRRLRYDDCLVNDGQPLSTYDVIAFSYGNTNMYPLSVASAKIMC